MVLFLDPTPISHIVANQVKWDMRTHNQEENFKNSGMTVNSWGHALVLHGMKFNYVNFFVFWLRWPYWVSKINNKGLTNSACPHEFTAILEFLKFSSWLCVLISHFTWLGTMWLIGVGSKNRTISEEIFT